MLKKKSSHVWMTDLFVRPEKRSSLHGFFPINIPGPQTLVDSCLQLFRKQPRFDVPLENVVRLFQTASNRGTAVAKKEAWLQTLLVNFLSREKQSPFRTTLQRRLPSTMPQVNLTQFKNYLFAAKPVSSQTWNFVEKLLVFGVSKYNRLFVGKSTVFAEPLNSSSRLQFFRPNPNLQLQISSTLNTIFIQFPRLGVDTVKLIAARSTSLLVSYSALIGRVNESVFLRCKVKLIIWMASVLEKNHSSPLSKLIRRRSTTSKVAKDDVEAKSFVEAAGPSKWSKQKLVAKKEVKDPIWLEFAGRTILGNEVAYLFMLLTLVC